MVSGKQALISIIILMKIQAYQPCLHLIKAKWKYYRILHLLFRVIHVEEVVTLECLIHLVSTLLLPTIPYKLIHLASFEGGRVVVIGEGPRGQILGCKLLLSVNFTVMLSSIFYKYYLVAIYELNLSLV